MIKIRKDLRIISQIFFYPWSYDQQSMKKSKRIKLEELNFYPWSYDQQKKARGTEPADSVHTVDESYHAESPKVG